MMSDRDNPITPSLVILPRPVSQALNTTSSAFNFILRISAEVSSPLSLAKGGKAIAPGKSRTPEACGVPYSNSPCVARWIIRACGIRSTTAGSLAPTVAALMANPLATVAASSSAPGRLDNCSSMPLAGFHTLGMMGLPTTRTSSPRMGELPFAATNCRRCRVRSNT